MKRANKLAKKPRKQYDIRSSLVCQEKGDSMKANHKLIKPTLRDDRGIWVVRARVYDPHTRSIKERTRSTGLRVKDNTKRQAQEIMRAFAEAWEKEANTPPVAVKDPLFSEYVEKWLQKKEATKRANTSLSYRQYAELHIIPEFGKYKVKDITRQMLQEYANMKLKKLSVSSVKKQFIVIRGALHDAAVDDVISSNPAENVEFPEAVKFEGKSYTPDQVLTLLEAAAKEGEPIHSAILLAVIYGLRRSEICGLRWKDIDFDSNRMYIRHTKTQNGSLVLEGDQTKTKKSRRTIDLIESTVPYLQKLKEDQKRNGLKLDKVCVWPDGREVRPDFVTRRTGQIMKKYGLEEIRLHDLRHTAATLLARKATAKQVQEFLGHSDVSITMGIYAHLLEEDRKETSGIMDSILKNAGFCGGNCGGN